jgi:hypothetical protein
MPLRNSGPIGLWRLQPLSHERARTSGAPPGSSDGVRQTQRPVPGQGDAKTAAQAGLALTRPEALISWPPVTWPSVRPAGQSSTEGGSAGDRVAVAAQAAWVLRPGRWWARGLGHSGIALAERVGGRAVSGRG